MMNAFFKNAFLLLNCMVFCSDLLAQQIGHSTIVFNDPSRNNRAIQTEVYYPATADGNDTPILAGTFPLVVFGHGFVMAWSSYENMWTSLVPQGYIVAFPTTEGGLAPVHADFGLDLTYLVSSIQSSGAGGSVPAASVGSTSAIMGHSMGGGSTFLAGANNTAITTIVTLAAANTNPSSVSAAIDVSVPTLLFSGTNDCVTPPAQHQDLMYNSTGASYKTQIYISGGGHCNFADFNFNCTFGEATCTPTPTISRAEQQSTTEDFLKLWLGYFLKGECSKAQEFQDSLAVSTRISYRQSQSIACLTGIADQSKQNNAVAVFPNPSDGTFTVSSKQESIRQVLVYDLLGKLIQTYNFDSPDLKQQINLSHLEIGTYLLKINSRCCKITIAK